VSDGTVSNGNGERDGRGRFVRFAGPGNPGVARLAELQDVVRKAISRPVLRRALKRLVAIVERSSDEATAIAACRVLLDRALGRVRDGQGDGPQIEPGDLSTTAGVLSLARRVTAALAAGELPPAQATALLGAAEVVRRAIETDEHEKRIGELERAARAESARRW
jgi:hypothetical protein